jgi:hypothetical protein
MSSRRAASRGAAWVLAALLAWCGSGGRAVETSGKDGLRAVHLVKITYDKEIYVLKGFFEGSPEGFVLKAENEIGVGVFTVTWDGKLLSIKPAGKMVAAMVPFDLRNIAIDIWRIIAEWSKGDVKAFNRNNDPDLPEDGIVIAKEKDGVRVKKIMKGDGAFAEARYYSTAGDEAQPFMSAGTIRFKNELIGYEITILQKPL